LAPWLSHWMSFSMSWTLSTWTGTVYAEPLPEMTAWWVYAGLHLFLIRLNQGQKNIPPSERTDVGIALPESREREPH
jgi:hypothetical protein